MMRRDALAMGAAVLAAVPVVISPLTASAADAPGGWAEWVKLYQYNINDPTTVFLYDDAPFAYGWKYYWAAVNAVIQTVYIDAAYEITPDSYSSVSGYYLLNGVRRFGSMYGDGIVRSVTASREGATMEPVTLVSTQDGDLTFFLSPTYLTEDTFDIRKIVRASGLELTVWRHTSGDIVASWWYDGSGIFADYSYSTRSGHTQSRYIRAGDGSAVEFSQTSDYIATSASSGRLLLGEASTVSGLPTSTGYDTITPENALDYVENVLNPYFVETYPEIEPYIYTVEEPYEPIYPSEFAEGIPKGWTVENPRLPSYSLDLQLPTADFDAVDVSTPLEHHATGLRFWWALLGECLDHFGVKELVIFALALGLIITILTRLGR